MRSDGCTGFWRQKETFCKSQPFPLPGPDLTYLNLSKALTAFGMGKAMVCQEPYSRRQNIKIKTSEILPLNGSEMCSVGHCGPVISSRKGQVTKTLNEWKRWPNTSMEFAAIKYHESIRMVWESTWLQAPGRVLFSDLFQAINGYSQRQRLDYSSPEPLADLGSWSSPLEANSLPYKCLDVHYMTAHTLQFTGQCWQMVWKA